jgi:hypothetical protein
MWFAKQKRASIYKSLKGKFAHRTVVVNATNGGDIDMMFYTNYAAYGWVTVEQYNKLKKENTPMATFVTHKSGVVPAYIQQDNNIVVIPDILE